MPVVTPHDPTLFQIGHKTDAGRSGKNNEDDYGLFATRYPQGGAPVQVAVVADGIGGHAGGEWASSITVTTIQRVMLEREDIPVRQRLDEAIRQANSAIHRRSLEEPNLAGMGTTVVAAAILQETLYVAHLGDSRAYLIRDGRAHRLTVDHSWAQEAVDAGRLSVEAAKVHPNRHVIKRFLGIDADVEVDHTLVAVEEGDANGNGEIMTHARRVSQVPIQPGDAILLCSDGLTDVVSDKEIARVVSRRAPQDAAERLVDLANKAGGPDNITAVILKRQSETQAAAAGGGSRTPLLALLIGLLALALVAGGWFLLAGRGGPAEGQTTEQTTDEQTTEEVVATQMAVAFTATAGAAPPTATEASTNTATPPATETSRPETPTPEDAPPEQAGAGTPAAALLQTATPNSGENAKENAIAESDTLSATAPLSQTSGLNPASETPTPARKEGMTTSTPRPTQTSRATSTPVPRRANPEATATAKADEATAAAPTSTPVRRTPTPTPDATPTLRAGILRTPSPILPSQPAIDSRWRVTDVKPKDQTNSSGDISFEWIPNFTLPQGFAYEVIFWKKNQRPEEGHGIRDASKETQFSINIANNKAPDTYYWAVWLVTTDPYQRIKQLSKRRSITISSPSSGHSDTSHPSK